MISKIKALSLAFVAITAMSAVASSAAQAGVLDVGAQPAVLTGQIEAGQEFIYAITRTNTQEKFNAICTSASLEATTTGLQTDEVTATPTFGPHCTFLGQASQFVANGCKYTLTGTQTTAVLHPANTFTLDIVGCTAGKQIEIKTAICTLHIKEQNHLSHVIGSTVVTAGVPHEVTLSMTISGIHFQQTGALCPDGNLHTGTNFALTANTVLKATNHLADTQVTLHGHQYLQKNHGQQLISLTST